LNIITKTKREQLKREGEQIAAELAAMMKTKNHQGLDALTKRFDAWETATEKLDFEESRSNVTGKYAAVRASGGDLGSGDVSTKGVLPMGATGRGKDVYPLGITKKDARDAFEAIKRGQNFIVQAKDATSSFSTVDSLLVAQQAPGIVPEYFEARLIDHLPVTSISAPSYQFIQHNYANDSGGPGFTAEGTQKPQWEPSAEKVVVTAQKLAVFFNLSSESIQDAPQWESYLINTGYQKIYQAENAAILYGTPDDDLGIQGWSTQTGILAHNASSDPSGSTNLDSIELAINALRVQSGVFAVPDLCIMSPTTWSYTRRLKSTTNQYLAGDPLQSPVHSVWGIPVLVTTAANDGDCFLVDSSKMGSVLIREGLSMHMGYTGFGLVENILTVVEEERLTLATVIPSAVQYVTNLAVS
jgi:HK97 family phage major capsid protein